MKIQAIAICTAIVALVGGCTHQNPASTPHATLPSTNGITAVASPPPGDIPDTQQFVLYRSAHGYRLLFPEGWARSTTPHGVTFTWHFDGEQLLTYTSRSVPAPSAGDPAIASAIRSFHNVRGIRVHRQRLPGGLAVVASFASQSHQSAVTGRRIALENQSYLFHRGSQTVALNLWAPAGSDNVDQWRRISRSFRW